jgi:hypothetical protein
MVSTASTECQARIFMRGGVNMAGKDAFTGAKTALMAFDAYVNMVAQEIGMERAVSLMTKTFENMGAMQGQMMKEQAHIKEFDAKTAWSLLKTTPEDLGIKFQVIEESPKRVVVKAAKCPIYEAAQMLAQLPQFGV